MDSLRSLHVIFCDVRVISVMKNILFVCFIAILLLMQVVSVCDISVPVIIFKAKECVIGIIFVLMIKVIWPDIVYNFKRNKRGQ